LAATIEAQGAISEERLAECFDRLDSDDSGYISADNLAELLGEEFPRDEIEEIIKEADADGNGKVTYSDFLLLWEQKHEGDRADALNMLGDPMLQSPMSMLTASVSSNSKFSEDSATASQDEADEREAAKARVSFVKEKARASFEKERARASFEKERARGSVVKKQDSHGIKHVGFEDTFMAIKAVQSLEQTNLEDDPVFVEDEGIHI
jgi:hypothetical protein